MTRAIVKKTLLTDSRAAGLQLGAALSDEAGAPDAVLLFAAPEYDYGELLPALVASSGAKALVGCSTAGEFINTEPSRASAVAIGLWSSDIVFSAAFERGLQSDRERVAHELARKLGRRTGGESRFRTALVFADALAGYTEQLMDRLTVLTAGEYQFAGGGAADNAKFAHTHVFCGTEAASDAVVILDMVSTKPIGLGVSHGWHPATAPLRITESRENEIFSMNAAPAGEVFEEFAAEQGQPFKREDPLPFFLHHVIGISTPAGHKLRVPLQLGQNDSVICAADVPTGALVSLMSTDATSTADSAAKAVQIAKQQMHGHRPAVALFFDCAATRLRLGNDFGIELDAVSKELGDVPFAGCNTYGQIARADGQFSGFHNCTAVVCLIPS